MFTPVNPRLTILKWGVRGSSLHGIVSMIVRTTGFSIDESKTTVGFCDGRRRVLCRFKYHVRVACSMDV